MRFFEGVFLWTAIGIYLASSLLFLGGLIFKKEKQLILAWRGCVAGFALHSATILARWIASGHPPVLWSFEHALAGSWFVMGIFLMVGRYFNNLRITGTVISPFVLLMLGYGIMGKELGIEPLPPPYQSNWLWVHVGFGWVTYGAYHVAAGLAILYLLKQRALRKIKGQGEISRFFRFFPELAVIDDLTFKLIVYGFIAHIAMLGSGAIWAYGLWGRYWAWDPIETWTLVSWLIYGITIHLRMTYHLKGNRFAWLAIVSLAGVLIFFGGIGFTKGVHTPLL